MLKPGGQFIFNVFEELVVDEAYEKLDQGKWRKYNNVKGISPFYKCKNKLNEYEKIVANVGYVDCHIFWEKFEDQQPLNVFEGKVPTKYLPTFQNNSESYKLFSRYFLRGKDRDFFLGHFLFIQPLMLPGLDANASWVVE